MANAALRRIVLLCALLPACPSRALDDVARVTTPAEERAAFEALARLDGVGFTAHDADGRQLDLASPRWWERTRMLRIHADGRTIEHSVIDPDNIDILMRE